MQSKWIRVLTIGSLLLLSARALADEILPSGSKPLSEVIKKIEDKKFGLVRKVQLDDGLWEITAINTTGDVILYKVDPRDGSVIREKTDTERHADRPTSDDKPLSEIVGIIEKSEKAPVSEIEFDDDVWKVSLRSETDKISFHLDPRTGQKLPMR